MRGLRTWPLVMPTVRAREDFPAVPAYLYDYPLQIKLMHAPEYTARNRRTINPLYASGPRAQPMGVAVNPAYSHIARRPYDGWGHVPQTPLPLVEKRQKMAALKREVKQQC